MNIICKAIHAVRTYLKKSEEQAYIDDRVRRIERMVVRVKRARGDAAKKTLRLTTNSLSMILAEQLDTAVKSIAYDMQRYVVAYGRDAFYIKMRARVTLASADSMYP